MRLLPFALKYPLCNPLFLWKFKYAVLQHFNCTFCLCTCIYVVDEFVNQNHSIKSTLNKPVQVFKTAVTDRDVDLSCSCTLFPHGGALVYLRPWQLPGNECVRASQLTFLGNVVTIRMISQRDRGELARFYTVTDPKKHQKGYTVYKVTARVRKRRVDCVTATPMLGVVSLAS